MKHSPWSLIALPAPLLGLCLVVLPTAGAAAPTDLPSPSSANRVRPEPTIEGPNPTPVIEALDPETARREENLPAEQQVPLVRYQRAALPNPANADELTDQVFAPARIGQPLTVQPGAAKMPVAVGW